MPEHRYTAGQAPAALIKARASRGRTGKISGAGMDSGEPVVIAGRSIARTWWGKAWIANLERYADFYSRLGRGRTYVRAGAVLDLKIRPGEILGCVQGSRRTPYQVRITLDPLPQNRLNTVLQACGGSILSLDALLTGSLPADLSDLLTNRESGLFPNPRQIHFACDCPDWADLCKHAAAVLYGIGARLDHEPELFFLMRHLRIEDFVSAAVARHARDLTQTADEHSERIMELSDPQLAALFHYETESPANSLEDM
ncbi:MAG: hypothetical protein VB070_08085 [Clostridiaceae bacterium]|nr:hypothetical protein [Clostridiaceae bacterium]